MTPARGTFAEEFTLNLLGPGLDGFEPPDGQFDSSGAWTTSYGVYSLAGECDLAGKMTLRRKPVSGGRAVVSLEYEKSLPGDHVQSVTAEITCKTDILSTPVAWNYTSSLFNRAGEPLKGMTLRKRAEVHGDIVELHCGGRVRKVGVSKSYTINWLMFELVQRLPRKESGPLWFTMLDDFDQVKTNQRMSFHKSVDIKFAGGRTVRLHAFDQVGEGIVPWVYWVDDQGRLLFAVSGIEAYIWQPS